MTYDNDYLITLQIDPLRTRARARARTHTHTLAPAIMPLLEAPVEGFFWNLSVFSRRIRFDVLRGFETRSLKATF
jgi:hypothetical protein